MLNSQVFVLLLLLSNCPVEIREHVHRSTFELRLSSSIIESVR